MITRACSYECTIKTSRPASEYSQILIVFQQQQYNHIIKTENDVRISGTSIVVNLTQEETARLSAEYPCLMQIRCYASEYDAPGSAVWKIPVNPALDDRIFTSESDGGE